jgi:hypothetical protein
MLITYWVMSAIVAVFVAFLWYRAFSGKLPAARHELRLDSLWWPIGLVAACVLAGGLFLFARRFARRPSARRIVVAGAVVLFGAESAFLLFSGVGINTYSKSFFPVTPAIARLKAVVGSGLVGLDTGTPTQSQTIEPVGFYPNANLGYGIAEYAGHDPVIPQVYFTSRGGMSYVEPDIGSAALAREYGIAWILQEPGTSLPAPPGTRYAGSFAGERLYAVPGATRFSLITRGGSGASRPVSSIRHPVASSWTLRIDASAPSQLVMRVTDLPGWHASIDGRALALSRYRGLMLEAAVPALTSSTSGTCRRGWSSEPGLL